jgi:hypothetical protein
MTTLSFLFLFEFIHQARAGANSPASKQGQIFIGLANYRAKKSFNGERDRKSFPDGGRFQKNELNYFTIVNLNSKWNAVATGSLLNHLSYKSQTFDQSLWRMGDQFLGARYVRNQNNEGAESWQALFSLPFYSSKSNPTPGNAQNDIEIRYLKDFYQRPFWGSTIDFISLEFAYRHRLSDPADQARFDFTLGKSRKNILYLIQLFAIQSLKNEDNDFQNSNPNATTDFDLAKVGPSLVWRTSSTQAWQISYLHDVWGRNVGQGRTLQLTWWGEFGQ